MMMCILKIRKKRQEKEITFLFGLFSFYQFKPIFWQVKISSIPLLTYYKYNHINKLYKGIALFSPPPIKKDIEEDCLFHISKQVPQEYENIVYIRSGLGETFLLNLYIDHILTDIGFDIKKTCFVGSRDTFGDIFKQYNPDILYKKININWDYLCLGIEDILYKYKNKKIYFYLNKNFIYNLMDSYKDGIEKINFSKKIVELFSIKPEGVTLKKYSPTPILKSKTLDYLLKNKINVDNFIFISKDAVSIEKMSDIFWRKLEKALKDKGFDIFYNSEDISITQAKIIASLSKAIIALRSGFSETLLELEIPTYILYTTMKLNGISAKNMLDAYSLKEYPNANINLIYEYNNETMTEDKIFKEIMKGF